MLSVSFDLNNEEALSAPPESQDVVSGETATRPSVDPTVIGFKFDGWYEDAEGMQEFDFSTPISKRTTIYAKWTANKVDTIDGSDLPSYDFIRDGAYGERPDLEGFIIDGKMGEEENWEDQKWYHNGVTEAPTVSYDVSTQFSEKGLYVFLKAYDNGGLAFTGRGYHYKNTGWNFWIGHSGQDVYSSGNNAFNFIVDTYNVKGDYWCVKMAINIAEGVVNPIGENKYGAFNVEMFITWDELKLPEKPDSINIFPQYKYKRIQSATSTLTLTAPFAGTVTDPKHYVPFSENGYMLADSENAILGDSSLGIAKTSGWDIENESALENAYVQTTVASSTTQALFFKNITGNYYEVETEIDPANATLGGRAGIMIYNSKTIYNAMTFEINSNTVNGGEFVLIRPRFSVTDKNGALVHKFLDPIEAPGEIKLKTLFANGYVYYILNDKLFHSAFLNDLNVRTTPALYVESGGGIKFTNYKSIVHTEQSIAVQTKKYAYVVSLGRLSNLSIDMSSTGVSVEGDNAITLYLNHGMLAYSSAVRTDVLNGDFSGIKMYEIDTMTMVVDNEETIDLTPSLTNQQTGAKYGEYVLKNIKGNSVITSTSRKVDTDNLTIIVAKIIDDRTKGNLKIGSTVTIKSNNPRMSCYSSAIIQSYMVAVVQKGYDYELTVSAQGYRTQTLAKILNVTDKVELADVIMVNNVVGGTATSKTDKSFTIASAFETWDYSHENDGYIVIETPNFQRGDAYFTGEVISRYQVAQVKITNIIDTEAYAKYEGDPAAGFAIVDKLGRRSFIGLHRNGLRVLADTGSGWNPTHYHTMGYSIINKPTTNGNVVGTLTMVKIDKVTRADCYVFIDGQFIAKIELEGRGGETALGFAITSSYYSKIKFFDYWIKTGDEALELAESLAVSTFTLDENTCYEFNEEWEADFDKPIIKVSGYDELDLEGGGKKQMAFIGSKATISLNEEYALDGVAYSVKMGDSGSVILTTKSPSAVFECTSVGDNLISLEMTASSTVTGKIALRDEGEIGIMNGRLIDDKGRVISFVTGEDGSFSVDVCANTTYSVEVNLSGYVCETLKFSSGSAKSTKEIGNVYLQPLPLGAKTPAGINSGVGASYGYGYDDGVNKIDGVYVEVDATGDNGQAYHKALVEDVIVKFSYFRKEIPDIEKNEHNPAIGIRLVANGKAEFYGFWQAGSVMLPVDIGWVGKLPTYDVMNGKVSEYDKAFDFVIVRKGMNISLYGKVASDSEYKYITTYTSTIAFGKASMLIHCTNGNPNNYFLYNIDIKEYSIDALPAFMVKSPSITGDGNGTYTFEGSSLESQDTFAIGDTVTVNFAPNQGYVPAYLKVDGKIYNAVNDKVTFIVTNTLEKIEVVFEPSYDTFNVVASIKSPIAILKVNVVTSIADGRSFRYDNLDVVDGKVYFKVRADVVKMYAYSDTYASKTVNISVNASGENIGTLDLSTPLIGSVVVNGKTLNTNASTKWDFDYVACEYNNNSYGSFNWLQNSATKGDFVLEASVTLNHADKNSKYYSPDRTTGFVFGDGSNNFSILLNLDGFRICGNGWSTTEMVETHNGNGDWYKWDSVDDVTHTVRIVRIGASFILYVDGKLETTIDTINGVVSAYGNRPNTTGGTGNVTACNEWIKQRVADMFASSENEIAVGIVAHIGGNIYNNAGIGNFSITTDPDVVGQYK